MLVLPLALLLALSFGVLPPTGGALAKAAVKPELGAGLAGAAAVDVARIALGQAEAAYAVVFVIDAALFIASAMLAARINRPKISKTGGFGPMVPAQ
jgi:hypothetical protein